MRKFTIFLTLILFIGLQSLYAQTKEISGKVTGDDGESIPGVSVVVKGTTIGITTDLNGEYVLMVPEDAKVLVFSYVGMKTQEVEIGTSKIINAVMEPDIFRLDEVIVSGVASGTQRKKLTVSVSKVGTEALEEVPAINAASAIQGKLSGVRVTNNTGQPGNQATILIRGATSLMGSQEPLYIVDGTIIEGTLADINVDDIESVEVVKGASASALYGSRAGNGVVVIKTKRGETLAKGETRVTIRNEYGVNQIPKNRFIELAEHHHYKLKDPNNPGTYYTDFAGITFPADYKGGTVYDNSISGSLMADDDHYADNNYAYINDHQDRMFRNGAFYTNYISVGHNSNKTNLMGSFENTDEEGVVEMTDGYSRQNFRLNVDHWLSKKLKFSGSQLVGKSSTNAPGGQYLRTGGIFFDVLFLWPDCDLDRKNEQNGQPYDLDPSFWNDQEENPLYSLHFIKREEKRNYAVGAYQGQWYATDWLIVDAKYAFDRRNTHYTEWQPKGFLERGGSGLVEDKGYYRIYDEDIFSYTGQLTLHLQKKFNDLSTKAKLSYLYEDYHMSNSDIVGYDFSVAGMPSMNAITGNTSTESEIQDIIANNFFGIFQFDYKGKYLADVMFRMDGSSLFGENERWAPYFRVSGAYRLTEDFPITGIQELKLRAAYGTSGQRPGFYAQYETYIMENGFAVGGNTLGNKDLKPSLSKEFEVGLNMEFLNRFSFEYVYAKTNTEDQIMLAPLPAFQGGFKYQWRNAGALESRVHEATLSARVFETENFKWRSSIIFDRIRQEVTALDIPPFQTGPIGQDADQVFYIREGEIFGMIYGTYFLRSLDELAQQLPEGDNISNYEINSDGYVVPAGSQGTIYEKPIKDLDENGNPVKQRIGNTNPDFRLGFANTLSYKCWSMYFLFDWKYGGDVYNRTKQWLYRDLRHGDVDQSDKAPNEKKTVEYYQALYDVNDVNSHFVEDATYVKLRELSIYYTLKRDKLKNFANGFFKGVKIGLVGRNLLTFTNYTGYDPEVGQINDSAEETYYGSSQFFQFDAYGYPNYRTISGSLTLTF